MWTGASTGSVSAWTRSSWWDRCRRSERRLRVLLTMIRESRPTTDRHPRPRAGVQRAQGARVRPGAALDARSGAGMTVWRGPGLLLEILRQPVDDLGMQCRAAGDDAVVPCVGAVEGEGAAGAV